MKITTTDKTATGRRLGARSPRFETNGTRNRAPSKSGGNPRMMKVSALGGLRERRANNHQNGQSGFGFAPSKAGSGNAPGPFGPTIAASRTTTMVTSAEKSASLSIASPKKGTPCSWRSLSYSC